VPRLRKLVLACSTADEGFVWEFLHSEFHEERLFALLCLIAIYKKAGDDRQKRIYEMYLAHTDHINNWDLVDISAPYVVGAHLEKRPRNRLYELAASRSLWERRIAIIATLHFIRLNDLTDTLRISRLLLTDREDLIHKAAGWMLREAGKRDTSALEAFLERHASSMPRTMLRYAIEKYPPAERRFWLKQKTKK
jgi:3-methyladenine DNA glycosylase AlkD